MVKSEDLLDIAITHYKNGKMATEVVLFLANKVHQTTVLRWIRRYDRTGSFSAGKSTGRSRSGRTKRLINLVRRRLESKNIRKSLRTMSTDFQSTRSTIERVLKVDLKKKYYRRKRVQKLQDRHQSHRKRNCSWIRKKFKPKDVYR